ncbi:DUF3854 domain-containing protein (plasmid) [Cyanobacterium sp. IPPAS B-1200]|uniref:DUF3854 domain-containing protein n=1 Tax=Cyanobacterium sp. IPPAS B-1200 TaxID=1562720 RepID=UPI00085277C4|nr:DUF3854 domain-containing protein [Cyanobacterium sp. IPPAS B-1200]OEJ78539.1 hypothetical protein A5482_12560 [Cyanobacterium sp. IPPAS B-1200]
MKNKKTTLTKASRKENILSAEFDAERDFGQNPELKERFYSLPDWVKEEMAKSKITPDVVAMNIKYSEGHDGFGKFIERCEIKASEATTQGGGVRTALAKQYNHLYDGYWWSPYSTQIKPLIPRVILKLEDKPHGLGFKDNSNYAYPTLEEIKSKGKVFYHYRTIEKIAQKARITLPKNTLEDCYIWIRKHRIKLKVEIIKYENLQGQGTPPMFPNIPFRIIEKVAQQYDIKELPEDNYEAKWQWIENNSIPITITEGLKKALSLISQGIISIASVSITTHSEKKTEHLNSYQTPLKQELLPFLIPGREVYLAFDCGDKKESSRKAVARESWKVLGKLNDLKCIPYQLKWLDEDCKGIDDYIYKYGKESLNNLYQEAKNYHEIKTSREVQTILSKRVLENATKINTRRLVNKKGVITLPIKQAFDNDDIKLVGIKSQQSTGKTQIMEEVARKLQLRGDKVLTVTHRQSLEENLNQRLNLASYRGDDTIITKALTAVIKAQESLKSLNKAVISCQSPQGNTTTVIQISLGIDNIPEAIESPLNHTQKAVEISKDNNIPKAIEPQPNHTQEAVEISQNNTQKALKTTQNTLKVIEAPETLEISQNNTQKALKTTQNILKVIEAPKMLEISQNNTQKAIEFPPDHNTNKNIKPSKNNQETIKYPSDHNTLRIIETPAENNSQETVELLPDNNSLTITENSLTNNQKTVEISPNNTNKNIKYSHNKSQESIDNNVQKTIKTLVGNKNIKIAIENLTLLLDEVREGNETIKKALETLTLICRHTSGEVEDINQAIEALAPCITLLEKLKHHEEINIKLKALNGNSTCIDSILKLKKSDDENDEELDDHYDVVFLDEVEQLIIHMLNSTTHMKNHRVEKIQYLIEIVKKAKKIVIVDADLSNYGVLAFKELLNLDKNEISLFENINKPFKGREMVIYENKNALLLEVRQIIAHNAKLSKEGKEQKRLYLTTSAQKVKSTYSAVTLQGFLVSLGVEEKDILLIDSETTKDPNHKAFKITKDLSRLRDYLYVIASPSITTGVSLEPYDVGEFDYVVGFFGGNYSLDTFSQQLERYRGNCPRFVWLPEIGRYDKQYLKSPREIERIFKLKDNIALDSLGLDVNYDIFTAKLISYCRIFNERSNKEALHLKTLFTILSEFKGYHITYRFMDKDEAKTIGVKAKNIMAHNKEQRAIAVHDSMELDDSTAFKLKDKEYKTMAEVHALEKHELKNKYGKHNVEPLLNNPNLTGFINLYTLDLMGKIFAQLNNRFYATLPFEDVRKIEKSKALKAQEKRKEDNEKLFFWHYENSTKRLAIRAIIEQLGICIHQIEALKIEGNNLIENNPDIEKLLGQKGRRKKEDQAAVSTFLETYHQKVQFEIEELAENIDQILALFPSYQLTLCGISCNQNADHSNRKMQRLKSILRLLGYDLSCIARSKVDGNQIRYYKIIDVGDQVENGFSNLIMDYFSSLINHEDIAFYCDERFPEQIQY